MTEAQWPENDMRQRIASLEHIIGKQEEELHQKELRIAELDALIATMRENAVEREKRIAEMKAENERLRGGLLLQADHRAVVAEDELAALKAESERMRKGLRLIIERNPGQAHRIAIQILDPARAEEGGE